VAGSCQKIEFGLEIFEVQRKSQNSDVKAAVRVRACRPQSEATKRLNSPSLKRRSLELSEHPPSYIFARQDVLELRLPKLLENASANAVAVYDDRAGFSTALRPTIASLSPFSTTLT
jgi:hypothetical protein